MSLRRQFLYVPLLSLAVGCASTPTEPVQAQQPSENTPTAADDAAILDAWMAASRGRAAQKRAAEAEPFRPKAGEKNPVKLVQWAVAQPDRQAGWRACLELKSQQDRGTLNAFSPWPFICRAMLLAEQRMFSQSDRMLAASNITLASIEMSYIMGHLSKRRFDKVRGHLEKARSAVPEHPLLDYVSSLVATDKAEEFAYLEKVYAKDQRHFDVLTRLAKHYDAKGDSKATELLLAAANVSPQNTDMRVALAARFQKEGKADQAREQYLKLIEAVPFHEGALTFLADDAQKKGDKATELKYIQAMIKELKDTKERRTREAKLLAETNQVDAAEKAYKRLLEADPKMVAGNLYLAQRLLAKGKPFKAINRYVKAGEEGRKILVELADRYEVGKPLSATGKSLNPTIWAAEARLKKRFKDARKRAPLAKGGRISWTLIFDDQGQCTEVLAESKRVDDQWFVVGGVLMQLAIQHKSVAGGEISWDLNVP
ncbi:MAG: hypothetical protein VYB65_01000 [Myxococcota bacterium]|nr:hypothetical protein [Myxococcota bacterium]